MGLEGRVRRANTLVFLYDEEILAGTAAIKHPTLKHRRVVFQRAAVPTLDGAYHFELGWVVVDDAYRNRKLSRKLVEAAIETVASSPLFATSRIDRQAMHNTLRRVGFKIVGRPYASAEEEIDVLLFVRDRA
jgi:predicted GNAT family N-acyltransferase